MPVPTSSLYDLLISTQGKIRVYKHTQQSLLLTQPLTTGPVRDEGRLAMGELEMEPGVPQPYQSTDCKESHGFEQCHTSSSASAWRPAVLQLLVLQIQETFQAHQVLFFQLFWSPEQLWFSANFAYTVSKNSSSVFTHVSQWSLLTTIDNIIMF